MIGLKKYIRITFLNLGILFSIFSTPLLALGVASADTTINVSICQIMDQPTINVENTGTALIISGNSGEHAALTEHLILDGNDIAQFQTDSKGDYSISTGLVIGKHDYSIKSIDGCSTTKTSQSITVSYSGGLSGIIEILKNTFFSQINTLNSPINETSQVLTNMSGSTS
jgi:hypothetical protein